MPVLLTIWLARNYGKKESNSKDQKRVESVPNLSKGLTKTPVQSSGMRNAVAVSVVDLGLPRLNCNSEFSRSRVLVNG